MLFWFVLVSLYLRLYLSLLCRCSLRVVRETPHRQRQEVSQPSTFSGLQSFSQTGVSRYTKNYFSVSSTEKKLGKHWFRHYTYINTALDAVPLQSQSNRLLKNFLSVPFIVHVHHPRSSCTDFIFWYVIFKRKQNSHLSIRTVCLWEVYIVF